LLAHAVRVLYVRSALLVVSLVPVFLWRVSWALRL
jgi:hypothetical protein